MTPELAMKWQTQTFLGKEEKFYGTNNIKSWQLVWSFRKGACTFNTQIYTTSNIPNLVLLTHTSQLILIKENASCSFYECHLKRKHPLSAVHYGVSTTSPHLLLYHKDEEMLRGRSCDRLSFVSFASRSVSHFLLQLKMRNFIHRQVYLFIYLFIFYWTHNSWHSFVFASPCLDRSVSYWWQTWTGHREQTLFHYQELWGRGRIKLSPFLVHSIGRDGNQV